MKTYTIDDQLVFIENSYLEGIGDFRGYSKILDLDLNWELHISDSGFGNFDIQLILRINGGQVELNPFVKYVTNETLLTEVDYQFKLLYLRNIVGHKFVKIPWSFNLRKWTMQLLFMIIDNKLISNSFLLRMFTNLFNEAVVEINNFCKKGVLDTSFELNEYYKKIFLLEDQLFKSLGKKYLGSDFYSKKYGTNKSSLLIDFSYCTDLGVLEYFSALRIELAKRLLKMDATVKEVVFLLEFKSIAYFNYSFKKKTGVTPIDFKKLYIE